MIWLYSRGGVPGENARLFAFVNAAMGDAGILAWDQKYIHNFWRPVLGVREHDRSSATTDGGHQPPPSAPVAQRQEQVHGIHRVRCGA